MELQEIRRRFNLLGTTSGASDTDDLVDGSARYPLVDFSKLADNNGDPGTCAVCCTAHILLNDSAGRLRQVDFFPLTYLKLGGVVTLDVASSPSYTIAMPSTLIWTFDFTNITGTVLTPRFTSSGGAAGVTAIASGWLEFDIHY